MKDIHKKAVQYENDAVGRVMKCSMKINTRAVSVPR